jgi:hypothetical protein
MILLLTIFRLLNSRYLIQTLYRCKDLAVPI